MDVLDLQGSISLDTSAYEAALQRAVNLATQMSSSLQSAAAGGAQALQNAIANTGNNATQMQNAIGQAGQAAQQLGQSAGGANQNVNQLGQSMNGANQASNNFANTMSNAVSVALGSLFTQAITKAKDALVAFAKESVSVGMSFDSAMSQVAATMGVTADEVGDLRNFAQEMGSTTAYSATQAAEALNYMALAGYDAEKSMKMLPNVLQLAASGGMDLARASDMVTDASAALGLDMEQTADMVNQMAMAASKSNTSVSQLGEAFLQIGGTAKKLKGGTTELATILGILADNGMKGAEGGTHLRNMMNSLMSPTKDATDMMKQLEVELYDTDGNMRSLNDVFVDLRTAMSEMATQEERDKVITTIFNARDMKAAEAMLANVGDRYQELSGYIDQAAGSAQQMANTQLDNLQGDITLFKSAVEGAQIAVSEKLTPALRSMTKVGAQAVSEMSQAFSEHGLVAAIDAAKGAILNGFGEEARTKIIAIKAAVEAAAAAFLAYKSQVIAAGITKFFTDAATGAVSFATGIGHITTALKAMGTALMAHPIFLVAAAISAAMVAAKSALDDMTAAIEMPKNAYEELNDEQKAYIDGMNEVVKVSKESTDAYNQSVKSIDDQTDKYEKLVDTLYLLDSVEDLSASQKERMNAIVTELNGSLEGLNITIDKQTGHLKTERAEVEKVIASFKEKAKTAAYKERLIKLSDEQIDKEKALKEATEQRDRAKYNLISTEIELNSVEKKIAEEQIKYNRGEIVGNEAIEEHRKRLQELTEQQKKLTTDLETYKSSYGTMSETYRQVHQVWREGEEAIEDLAGALGDSATAAVENTSAMEDAAEATQKAAEMAKKAGTIFYDTTTEQAKFYGTLRGVTREWDEETVMAIADVIDKYVDYRKTVENSIKGSVDIFGEFKRDTSITFDDLMNSMEDNKKGVDDWALALQQLRKKGELPDELIDQWEEMGVASWGYVRALNHASSEQREDFAKTWKATQASLDNAVHQAVKDDKKDYDTMLSEIVDDSTAKLGEYKTMLEGWVVSTADSMTKAMEDAVKIAKGGAEKTAEEVENALNGIDAAGIGTQKGVEFTQAMAAATAQASLTAKLGNLYTGADVTPKYQDGKVYFPHSSVGQNPNDTSASSNKPLTINLMLGDAGVIASATVDAMDYEQGKRTTMKTKGYAG